MLRINSNNSVKQDFSLPSPFIRYLMVNADSEEIKKLYKTCKYFYARLQINIVDVFCLDNKGLSSEDVTNPYTIQLYPNQLDQLPNNLWLTDEFYFGDNINIEHFFSKVYKFELCQVHLYVTTKFTLNELKILTQSDTVQDIYIYMEIYTTHESNDIAPLEDILSCLLSVNTFSYDYCRITDETMKKLMQLNFEQKLQDFCLDGITKILDVNLMDLFLKKNLDDNAYLYLKFENNDDDDDELFHSQMVEKLNAWTPEESKPRYYNDKLKSVKYTSDDESMDDESEVE